MEHKADLIDWGSELPEPWRTGIHSARGDLLSRLLDTPGCRIETSTLFEVPITENSIYRVIGALTLELEGFVQEEPEDPRFVRLTDAGYRFALGRQILVDKTHQA